MKDPLGTVIWFPIPALVVPKLLPNSRKKLLLIDRIQIDIEIVFNIAIQTTMFVTIRIIRTPNKMRKHFKQFANASD